MTVKKGLDRLLGGPGGAARAENTEDPEIPAAPEEEANTAAAPDAPEETAAAPAGGDAAPVSAVTRADTVAEGRKAERERIAGILNSPEAKGSEGLAQSLALDTDMDAASARTVLGKAAKGGGGLAAVMAGVPNPDVGPDGGGASAEDSTVESVAGRIVGKRRNSNQ